ncbi:MAG: mannonate dehydratase [bacterium]|nr:mannonate dehydratase [bacterium]
MYPALQTGDLSDDNLKFARQVGVEHVVASNLDELIPKGQKSWTKEALLKMREQTEKHGVKVEVVALPLSSHYIERAENPNIMLGTPGRDQEIEAICECIRAAGQAGISCLKYNLTLLGVVSTHRTVGRGGAIYRSFDINKSENKDELPPAGRVTADMMWERITYFLERVIPVAEEYKVKMACHQHDPAMPRETGYRGIDRVLGTVEGVKKFVDIVDSPYNGLNFCQGTCAEMLEDPAKEILDVIRYFGKRKKIFMVHFRNIRGKFLNFDETYVDEGSVDMWEAMKVYKEVGYQGVFCPDHVARSEQDTPWGHRQRAFTVGYIKALIKAVNNP